MFGNTPDLSYPAIPERCSFRGSGRPVSAPRWLGSEHAGAFLHRFRRSRLLLQVFLTVDWYADDPPARLQVNILGVVHSLIPLKHSAVTSPYKMKVQQLIIRYTGRSDTE